MTEPLLTGKRLKDEETFAEQYLTRLSKSKVKLASDYSAPAEKRPRKAQIIDLQVADLPDIASGEATLSSISLDIRCSKPALSYTLQSLPTVSVGELKQQLIDSLPTGKVPALDDQKWLIKGKVLQNSKLLQEYTTQDAGITLMLKPGSNFGQPTIPAPFPSSPVPTQSSTLSASTSSTRGHMRVPSLTLNTTELEPETATGPIHTRPRALSASFTDKIASPTFWKDTLEFLEQQMGATHSVRIWEEWFTDSKKFMTPSDVARVREAVGLFGMGGH